MADAIRVFLVEDKKDEAEICLSTISTKVPQVEVVVEGNFRTALERFKSVGADVVVLDLFEDPSDEPQGQPIWTQIWTTRFCPIIIHTAHEPPEDPPLPVDHPFVRFVKKGPGSDEQVANELASFLPHMAAVRIVVDEIRAVVQTVLQFAAPQISKSPIKPEAYDETLMRSVRRRVAAMMDLRTLRTAQQMQNWEQYIAPPLTDHPLLGDLVRLRDGDPDKSKSYRLVLTPSCDMVSGRARVKNVLAAQCVGIDQYLRGAQLAPNTSEEKKRERLPRVLTEDHCGGIIPLPGFPGVVPLMAASLRDLELLPLEEIGAQDAGETKYRIIASIDSPFRERIAWAYLQVAGRPGVPDCDMEPLVEGIIRATRT